MRTVTRSSAASKPTRILTLHGNDGASLDLSTLGADDQPTLEPRLAALLPDLPAQMRTDLLPLLAGNLAHYRHPGPDRPPRARQLDIEHRRMDHLHRLRASTSCTPQPGPDHRPRPRPRQTVRKAAGIIKSNAGRAYPG